MTRTKTINVMLADDNSYARSFFSSAIESPANSRIKITGLAANGLELLKLVEKELPEIVILDLAMPVMDGYKTLQILREKFSEIKVIIFSNFCSDYFISKLLIAGASAYVPKGTFIENLVEIIHKVHEENYYFTEKISRLLVTSLIEDKELDRILDENLLSDREIEVLRELCDEKSIKAISKSLYISENTVKHHKKSIYEKTNSRSMISLVKFAIKTGITDLK